jgi:RHS repeat-associated protein
VRTKELQSNRTSWARPLALALALAALAAALLAATALARHTHHAPSQRTARTSKRYWCGTSPDCRATRASARSFLHHGRQRASSPIATASRVKHHAVARIAQTGTTPETTGPPEPSHTWTNYTNAGGEEGPQIAVNQTIQIACRVKGFKVEDGDEWWYLIASSPWNYGFYVSADAFYNNGQTEGSLLNTPLVDETVPECGAGEGTPETTGGETHTWSNYGDAGGTKGMTIGGGATVHIACKVLGLAVADGNNWWYRISQAPWNNAFYASADAFYNNGQTTGSLAGTPFVDETIATCPEPSEAGATAETAGGEAHTWTNYADAGGNEGQTVEAHQIIQIECKLQGFAVADGNTWWYRIKQAPWSGGFYVSADAFYNGAPATGSLIGTPYVDGRVPTCPSGLRPGEEMTGGEAHTWANYSHAGAAQGPTIPTSSAVAVSCRVQGWAAPDGNTWWYLVASAPWNNVYYVSADAFYNGAPPTGNLKGTPFVDPSIPVCVGNHEAPIASAIGSGHGVSNNPGCRAGDPVDCASGDFAQTFTDVSISGRGPGLQVSRTYNSLNASTPGLFGYGWSSTLDQHLTSTEDGTELITLDDGSVITAAPDGSGGYTLPASADAALQHNSDGTYTLTEHATERLTFSATGTLTAISDLNGNTTTLSYTAGLLTTVTDPSGRTLAIALNGTGQIATITDPLGRHTTYEYDNAGTLIAVTDPAGRAWRFKYDEAHRLTQMTDPRGGSTQNEYDTQDRVTAQTDPAGLTTRFAYTGENFSPVGGTTTVTDPHGSSTIEQYDNGFLMQITKAAGTAAQSTSSYTYDPSTLGITSTTDGNGHTSRTVYDNTGQPTSTTDALGNTTTYTYNQLQQALTTTTPLERTTSRTYDAAGSLTTSTDPEGNTTHYQHSDPSHPGDLTAVIDPEGRTETLTYNNDGNIATRSSHPREGITNTVAYSYDADSEPTCEAPANATAAGTTCTTTGPRAAGTVTNTYNADGELTASTNAAGHTTSYAYDLNGNQTEIVDPRGNKTITSYDPDSRITAKTIAAGTSSAATTRHSYDIAAGTSGCESVATATYCESITDPDSGKTVNYYDARDELIATKRPASSLTTYSYDPAGNRISLTDAAKRVTTYRYDADNRQIAIEYSDGSTPNVEYAYDADGHRTRMLDGTGTSSYQYDKDGRLTELTEGSGASTSYEYDQAGLIVKMTYPGGKTITKSYDGAGRLASITDWLDHTTTFGYDADGNVTVTSYPNGDTITDSYNANDALTAAAAVSSNHKTLASIAYTRNENELISSETGKKLTGTSAETYDPANRLTSSGSASYEYDAADNPTSIAGAGQSYNSEDELTHTSTGATYSYDAVGDRTSSTPAATPGTRYSYDQAGRLTETVGFDVPTIKTIKPTSGPASGGTTVTIKGEHLEHATTVTFGGTPATSLRIASGKSITAVSPAGSGTVDIVVSTGDATSAVTTADKFTYAGTGSPGKRAVKAAPASPAFSYAYNGDGLRTSQTTGSSTSRYTWNITISIPEITSDSANDYIYGPEGLPIEQISTNGTSSYYLHDAIGSTRALLSSSGTLAATFNYTAYGSPLKGTGTARTPILYGGGYTDETTGQIYLVHRYYDPSTAQFLTVDPALLTTEEAYTYGSGDPLNSSDRSGLWSVCFGVCVGHSDGSWGVGFGLGFSAGGVGSFSWGTRAVYYPSTGIYSWGLDIDSLGGFDIEEQNGRIIDGTVCAGVGRVPDFSLCSPSGGGGGSSPAYPDPYQSLHPNPLQLFRPTSAYVESRCSTRYLA